MAFDLTKEDKYYYWLLTSIGLEEELVKYVTECVESNGDVSDLVQELYNESQDRNELKRILFFANIKNADVDKDEVKTRLVDFFHGQWTSRSLTLERIAECLGGISALEKSWTDFAWICENYSLADEGVFSYEEANDRLSDYLKENASEDGE